MIQKKSIISKKKSARILKSIILNNDCGNISCVECPMYDNRWICNSDEQIVRNAKLFLVDIILDGEFEEKI